MAGGQVYSYPGRLHSKALLVDDAFLFTGSAAYMGTALQELNLMIQDPETISLFKSKLFETDIQKSASVTLAELESRSRWLKFKSRCFQRLFHAFALLKN